MAPLGLVVAWARQQAIGQGGTLPWHVPEDLSRFKAVTLGHAIIMGRKTHESIGRPLPGRRNLVVSRTAPAFPGCEVVRSLDEALALARQTDAMPMIIGGAELYAQALPQVTHLFLTEIDRTVEADTFFPPFDRAGWHEVQRVQGPPDVTFVDLERKPS
jgi:dihydrofolate reductase